MCPCEANVLGLDVGQYGKCIRCLLKEQARDRHTNCFIQGPREQRNVQPLCGVGARQLDAQVCVSRSSTQEGVVGADVA
jgi:hypothetical protein